MPKRPRPPSARVRIKAGTFGSRPPWNDIVYRALRSLHGQATLQDLYRRIESTCPKKWLGPTWTATVRRTLQFHPRTEPAGPKGVWRIRSADAHSQKAKP